MSSITNPVVHTWSLDHTVVVREDLVQSLDPIALGVLVHIASTSHLHGTGLARPDALDAATWQGARAKLMDTGLVAATRQMTDEAGNDVEHPERLVLTPEAAALLWIGLDR